MFVQKIYDFIMFLKNQGQSQWFSPEEVMMALNQAQGNKYRTEYKQFEETLEVTDALLPFKTHEDITKDGATGLFLFPEKYVHFTNISSLLMEGTPAVEVEYKGKIYTDGEWTDAIQSQLLPPEDKHIKARITKDGIHVKPDTANNIRLYYLKYYTDANYAYDLVNGKITFKEQGSVDPDFRPIEQTDLIMRTFTYLGIVLNDEFRAQAEQLIKIPAKS